VDNINGAISDPSKALATSSGSGGPAPVPRGAAGRTGALV